jgi:hypothetical protein
MNKEKGYEDDYEEDGIGKEAAMKDSILASLMDTIGEGMGSKLKKPMAISVEVMKPMKKTQEEEG